jgi:hypothetical protein
MSDLISRKTLLEYLDEQLKEVSETKPNKIFTDDVLKTIEITGTTVKNYINDMPTSYDINKVVEQLKKSSDYEPIDYDYNDISATDEQYFIDTDKAIEIVKGGGIDE